MATHFHVANGVGQQVHRDLLHAVAVGAQETDVLGHLHLQLDLVMVGAGLDQFGGLTRHFAQIDIAQIQLQLAGIDGGDVQDIIDQLGQMLGRGADRAHRLLLAVRQLAGKTLGQHVGIAVDRRQRRAQLIAHMLDKLGLDALGGFQRLGPLAQGFLDPTAVGDIIPADQRGPVRQRPREIGQHLAIGPAHLAGDLLARLRAGIGDAAADIGPDPVIGEQRGTGLGNRLELRLTFQLGRLETPQTLKGVVVELQPAIGPEHGDRLVQLVQGGALDIDQRVVARPQGQLVCLVLEDQHQAAQRVALAGDPQRAAIRQRPELVRCLFGRGLVVARQLVRLPACEISLFRQKALLAHAVKELAVGRTVVEPGIIQLEQAGKGRVVEVQPLRAIEHHNGLGHVVQRLVMGTAEALQRHLGFLALGDVDGKAGGTARHREDQALHGAAAAFDDHDPGLGHGGAFFGRPGGLLGQTAIQRRLVLEHLVQAFTLDRLDIGRIDPFQTARRIHAPGREGRATQHVQEGHRVLGDQAASLFDASTGPGFLQAADRRIGQPDHQLRAGRPAIHFQKAAAGPQNGQGKGFATLGQIMEAAAQRGLLTAGRTGLIIS